MEYRRRKNGNGKNNKRNSSTGLQVGTMATPGRTVRNGGLTEMQELFCREFIVDMNISQAGVRAGYSEKVKGVAGWQVFQLKKVRRRINELMKDRLDKLNKRFKDLDLTAERLLLELASISFFNVQDLYEDDGTLKPISEWTERQAAAIASIKVTELFDGQGEDRHQIGVLKEIKTHPKVEAIKLGMKYFGLLHEYLHVKEEKIKTHRIEIDVKSEQIRSLNLGREKLEQFASFLSQLNPGTTIPGIGSSEQDSG